ncbi:hypothetical protein E1178_09590 [Roseibium hamelinense]|nr:hypothetical protein [Roseibium hamelinense]
MGETCVSCHNTHPQSPKLDWEVGDVRGIQAITMAQPIADNIFAFRYLLLYFAGAGTFGIAFAGLQWRQAARFNRMNLKLEQANDEILDLNKQLTNENLRLGAEIEIAQRIQKMVLPTKDELGELRHIEIAAYMEPADEVGGDYYDVLQLGERIKVGIGDVTGHGLESGVLMLMVQSVAVALQEQGVEDPKEFLTTLNRAICRNINRTKTNKHLTLSFLDYKDEKVTLSGQHEDVVLIRNGGSPVRIDTMDLGFPIGLDEDISPFVSVLDLDFNRGDLIILHTDGITEAEDEEGHFFGVDGLIKSADSHRGGSAEDVARGIIADVHKHIGNQVIHDDITLVVIRHK